MRPGGSIGWLRHRVKWFSPSRTEGDTGQESATFATEEAETWAEVVPASAFERFGHAQQYPEATHGIRFRLPSVPGVKHDWRATWGTRTFDVKGIVVAPDPQSFSWAECVELPESSED